VAPLVVWLDPRLLICLQYSRGHMTRRASALHIIRQLHLQRTYLLPGGGGRTGVASLQELNK